MSKRNEVLDLGISWRYNNRLVKAKLLFIIYITPIWNGKSIAGFRLRKQYVNSNSFMYHLSILYVKMVIMSTLKSFVNSIWARDQTFLHSAWILVRKVLPLPHGVSIYSVFWLLNYLLNWVILQLLLGDTDDTNNIKI